MKFSSDITVDLIDFMGGDGRVVQTARASTQGEKSEEKVVPRLIEFLMREGHMVPFEHSVFTFRIHAPIFVTRQLLKHRISSISEESGRYRELEPEFYIPNIDRPLVQVGKTGDYVFVDGDDFQRQIGTGDIIEACSTSWRKYQQLLEINIAKEVARMVLPVNIYSTMYMTVNAVSLMNIIKLRTQRFGSHPQFEVALVGEAMYAHFRDKMPVTAQAFALTRGDTLYVHDDGDEASDS